MLVAVAVVTIIIAQQEQVELAEVVLELIVAQ